jgi:hypothetical protein
MKKLALVLVIAAVIVLAFMFSKQPSTQPVSTTNLTIPISDFKFMEMSTGPHNCSIRAEPGGLVFEGPLTKPTPCNGLTVNYTTEGNTIKVYITTTPYEGFCSQVLQDTFYWGIFFNISQSADVQVYYGGEKICDKSVTIS